MTKKLIQVRTHLNSMTVTWVMNNICTNHCDYCPPVLHKGSNHNYSWDRAKEFMERILNRYLRVNLSLSGGEPTLSPFLPELVKMFNDRKQAIGITTNGARTVRYYEELAPMLSFLTFSYHPSYPEEQLIEKIRACSPHTIVLTRIMMDSRHWDRAVAMYNECLNNLEHTAVEAVIILSDISDRHVGNEYTPEQLQWIKDHEHTVYRSNTDYQKNTKWKKFDSISSFWYNDGSIKTDDPNELVNRGENDFRGWACNIGIESLCIHYNGWVGKATCGVGQNMFHIDDHAAHPLPERAEICTQAVCACGTDIRISKVPIMDKDDPYVLARTTVNEPKSEEEYNKKYYDENGRVIIPIRPVTQ
jgi:organic radical activating enzyme